MQRALDLKPGSQLFADMISVCSHAELSDDKLSSMETLILVTSLEDAIISLTLLDNCSNKLRVQKTHAIYDRLLEKKFRVDEEGTTTEDEFKYPLNSTESKLAKLSADKAILDRTFHSLIAELYNSKTFQSLNKYYDVLNTIHERSAQLTADIAVLKPRKQELRKKLIHLRNAFRNMVYTTNAIIDDLMSTITDTEVIHSCETRFVEKWQGSRIEQYGLFMSNTENESANIIAKYKTNVDYEARIHDEVELFNRICISELQIQVEDMVDKYDSEMEAIDLKIQKQRLLYDDARDRRIGLQKTMEKHSKELKEWINYKLRRERDQEYQKKMVEAVVIVQAWWRGLLVRLKLGPYNTKRGKKSGKKKGQRASKVSANN